MQFDGTRFAGRETVFYIEPAEKVSFLQALTIYRFITDIPPVEILIKIFVEK